MKMEMQSSQLKFFEKMVAVPDTLCECCTKLEETLTQLQPKLGLSVYNLSAFDVLSQIYPGDNKKIKSSLNKVLKANTVCSFCSRKMGASTDGKSALLTTEVDLEEETRVVKQLKVCCDKCYKLSVYSELLTTYLAESLIKSDESQSLSSLIDHFLKLNGYKLSDINVFNAAVSVAVSLKTTFAKLNLELQLPEPSTIEQTIEQLVSK